MAAGHVCDECKTVAPIDSAIGWWSLTSIEGYVSIGEKEEYHFCSWKCIDKYAGRQTRVLA